MKTLEEKKLARKIWLENNKEHLIQYRKQNYLDNKAKEIERNKNWRKTNSEYMKQYRKNDVTKAIKKRYYEKNKEKVITYANNYAKKRKQIDPLYRLKVNLRSRISDLINRHGYKKRSKTAQILGCSFESFKERLDSQLLCWMNWENYGKYNGTEGFGWDIDHIIPLSSAKSEEELIKLCHYTNLQPLCSYVNRVVKRHII